MKTDSSTNFYKYKNNKMYSTCIECFNKKVRCEFCNKELNKSYLKSHIKKQHMKNQHDKRVQLPAQLHTINNIRDDLLPVELSAQLPAQLHTKLNKYYNNDDNNKCNRTLIVGPSFCGKTLLLLNKLQLIRLSNSEKQIKIITRSPGQYQNMHNFTQLEDVSVEEDLEDRTIQDFKNCCVVFDDMLDSKQKLIDPFFTRGRHNLCDVYYLSQSYFDLPKRTIRNNSNIIILFQQTLKDVEHIYRDIAGFDMSYDEFKELCREAWKEKYNYLFIKRLEDKNGSKYQVCNESNPNYTIFHPQTEPF